MHSQSHQFPETQMTRLLACLIVGIALALGGCAVSGGGTFYSESGPSHTYGGEPLN
jgi:hypothetical protein